MRQIWENASKMIYAGHVVPIEGGDYDFYMERLKNRVRKAQYRYIVSE